MKNLKKIFSKFGASNGMVEIKQKKEQKKEKHNTQQKIKILKDIYRKNE